MSFQILHLLLAHPLRPLRFPLLTAGLALYPYHPNRINCPNSSHLSCQVASPPLLSWGRCRTQIKRRTSRFSSHSRARLFIVLMIKESGERSWGSHTRVPRVHWRIVHGTAVQGMTMRTSKRMILRLKRRSRMYSVTVKAPRSGEPREH